MKLVHRSRRQFGYSKETLAAEYLQSQGLKIIERNYQCRMGEIDLIVRDHSYLIFVEVRFRSNKLYGSSAESVDSIKQAKIIRCAQYYLLKNDCSHSQPCRFDVIGIQNGDTTGSNNIEWISDAFQA